MIPHIAGIVPVATKDLGFQMEWHDSLMPIAPNYHAVERAVLEAAIAGCKTIWIVANDDTTPLLRHRMGDFIHDPTYLRRMNRFPKQERRQVPIFYVPTATKHWNKMGCLPWNILWGAEKAHAISSSISKWTAPNRYYVSFPYSVYDPSELRPERPSIAKEQNFMLTYKGKSFLTGEMLGFTFDNAQRKKAVEIFKDTECSLLLGDKLENEEIFYETHFGLDNVFGKTIIDIEDELELNWWYPIDSWDRYCVYLSSEERKEVRHPGQLVISYREWNPVGVDDE
tara:strand:+ start:1514 stop:2362 length:849 start_codon:yes stop_codon:yes gene_type:complete